MKKNNYILKEASIFLVVAVLITSSVAMAANTTNAQSQVSPARPLTEDMKCQIGEYTKTIDNEKFTSTLDSGRAIILSEGFEGTWIVDPEGDGPPYMIPDDLSLGPWDIDGICSSSQYGVPGYTHYWSDFTPSDSPLNYSFPHSGSWCAGIWWSDGNGGEYNQDEWLITPELDTSGYSNLQLTFYSVYHMKRGGTNPNQHNYVKYSTNGGTSWNILGDLKNDAAFDFDGCTGGPSEDPNWNWNEVQIVIQLPNTNSLMIAWNYVWDRTSFGTIWMVDDIEITGEKAELQIENIAGGLGVSASIKNIGIKEAENVVWEITFDGGIILYPSGGVVKGGPINIPSLSNVPIGGLAIGFGGFLIPLNIILSAKAYNADLVHLTIPAKLFLIFVDI